MSNGSLEYRNGSSGIERSMRHSVYPSGADLAWRDIVGRPLPSRPALLSTSPVYLVAPAGKAADLLKSVQAKTSP